MVYKNFFDHNLWLRFLVTCFFGPLILFIIAQGMIVVSIFMLLVIIMLGKEWLGLIKKKRKLIYYFMGMLYIAIPSISIVYIADRSEDNYFLVKITCLVWASDVGAYIVGKFFGGPRINPKISPNKTWSGYYGGLFFTSLVGCFLNFDIPFSALISLLAQLGDLGESMIKRKFNAVNSGDLIPGHGGVMDRFDSFVLVALFLAISDIVSRILYG